MRLKDLRESYDKTQKEIAGILHCDQSLYSKYERNEREVPLWVLTNLSFYYDTSLDYIVGLTDTPDYYPRNKKSMDTKTQFIKEIKNRIS
ncbi:helix-turn-helix domain-containing protein [Enterococcus sp. AZ163]|uniref:helix-turn-helix domain-containing protein n=1 Tax=Enterococcus sp. AZ163 TaxID=2774638 RepID=UPI003D29C542